MLIVLLGKDPDVFCFFAEQGNVAVLSLVDVEVNKTAGCDNYAIGDRNGIDIDADKRPAEVHSVVKHPPFTLEPKPLCLSSYFNSVPREWQIIDRMHCPATQYEGPSRL